MVAFKNQSYDDEFSCEPTVLKNRETSNSHRTLRPKRRARPGGSGARGSAARQRSRVSTR